MQAQCRGRPSQPIGTDSSSSLPTHRRQTSLKLILHNQAAMSTEIQSLDLSRLLLGKLL